MARRNKKRIFAVVATGLLLLVAVWGGWQPRGPGDVVFDALLFFSTIWLVLAVGDRVAHRLLMRAQRKC